MDWYDAKIHLGIAEYARQRGWLLNSHMARTRQHPDGWLGDGVVGLITERATHEFVASLGLPTVDCGGHYEGFAPVLGDHTAVGKLAAHHFVERNHKRFVFLFVMNSRLEDELFASFNNELAAAGFGVATYRQHPASQRECPIDYQRTIRWMAGIFENLDRPVAVMSQNDDTAALVLQGAEMAGIHVPEEMAVLGAGNSEIVCEFQPITLSSIGGNLEGLGMTLAHELDRLMQGGRPHAEAVRVPPGRVHARQSTEFLAVSNPHVRTVLREIWHRYAEPLNIDKLTALVPVSRAGLYSLFNDEIGRSMARELSRVRIGKAIELLEHTTLSISKVGRLVGMPNLVSFSRSFTQATGRSPAAHRRRFREPEIHPSKRAQRD